MFTVVRQHCQLLWDASILIELYIYIYKVWVGEIKLCSASYRGNARK